MPDDESLCARCARLGPTCCEGTEVYLTPGDVRRVAAATGRDDFHERRACPDSDAAPDPALDPAWAGIFAPDGARRILKTPGGRCVFLRADGCALAPEARPLVCRLYPFDYTDGGIKGVDARLCPPDVRENGPLALAWLGMDRTEAELLRRRLYAEIAEETTAGL